MQVVITGAAGMLGLKLVREILKKGTLAGPDGKQVAVDRIVATDIVANPEMPTDKRVSFVAGDVFDPALIRSLVTPGTASIFHLAGVVSAGAERDFDLGYRVNLDGHRVVLEAARALGSCPRVVFASSLAAYGGDLPEIITDEQKLTPQTSYGVQKVVGELLTMDYTRKGFIDGRSLRLPTIVVRPGKPNLAASTFASSIIREPLKGERATCPVDPSAMMPLLSPRLCIAAFIRAHELPGSDWGWNRSLMLPSLDVSVAQMADGLKRVAGQKAYDLIDWKIDPMIAKIVAGWPKGLISKRARAMGFQSDPSMEAMIQAFIEDDLPAAKRAAG